MRKLYLFFLGICLIFSQAGFSQANSLSGIVQDASGSPIVGASVKVKGSKAGTVTDANGHFTLNVKTGQKLVISAIGFIQSEAEASAGMNVTLAQDVQSM